MKILKTLENKELGIKSQLFQDNGEYFFKITSEKGSYFQGLGDDFLKASNYFIQMHFDTCYEQLKRDEYFNF